VSVFRPPYRPFGGGRQPYAPKEPVPPGASPNQVLNLPTPTAITITGFAPSVVRGGPVAVAAGAGTLAIVGYVPTVARSGSGSLTTPVLKNNTGTVLANETGVIVNVYNAATGALVVQKTGQTSNGSGVVTVNDPADRRRRDLRL
jgi:hypothetical protein